MHPCPCNAEQSYEQCCGLYLDGKQIPPSPLTLMRSRYTAYTQKNYAYIVATMKPPASLDFDLQAMKEARDTLDWQGLKIISANESNETGQVEFIASYLADAVLYHLHERSDFKKINGQWFYVSGIKPKYARNDICYCGSGKKYKHCCAK